MYLCDVYWTQFDDVIKFDSTRKKISKIVLLLNVMVDVNIFNYNTDYNLKMNLITIAERNKI